MDNDRKCSHLSIWVEKELAERLRKHASQEPPLYPEKLTASVFTRSLLTWALGHYKAHGCSLDKLFKELPDPPDRKITAKRRHRG